VQIADSKTFSARFFSWKALHGFTMAFAWYQMLGRSMVTNPMKFEGCWTYPAFKVENSDDAATFVPPVDPNYGFDGREGTFVAMTSLPGIALFLIVGLLYSYCAGKKAKTVAPKTALLPPATSF
jgi:hypothetical protein